MRIRTLKPYMWEDEKIGHVTRDARLLFIGLITMADDAGRFRAIPTLIVGHIYPYDQDAGRKVCKWLQELETVGLIQLYGDTYGCIVNWEKHQRISHRTPSLLPNPSRNGPEPLRNESRA